MCEYKEFISRHLIGESPRFANEIEKIPIIAKCQSTVLVYGETGTGKEICVRVIHQLSKSASKPLVPVNCGAIPPELVENELFGHAQGAFTGASSSKPGLIREAEGGTLFLDEIDSLPLIVQVKLLRFLQERTYRPLGSTKECKADVRVVAAMNVDPKVRVESGHLRRDLFYRLNVVSIEMPPLRDRKEDIPLLANHFLSRHSDANSKNVTLSQAAIQTLLLYDWPGNVRELEHVIERAVVFAQNGVISEFPEVNSLVSNPEEAFNDAKQRVIQEFEQRFIRRLLVLHMGNITRAAEAAQKHRRAFIHLMQKHKIQAGKFRTNSYSAHPDPPASIEQCKINQENDAYERS